MNSILETQLGCDLARRAINKLSEEKQQVVRTYPVDELDVEISKMLEEHWFVKHIVPVKRYKLDPDGNEYEMYMVIFERTI